MEWSHDFCLFCDRQTAEGAYCSQACRVADLEKSGYSEPQTPASLPFSSSTAWRTQQSSNQPQFRLPPALDFAAYRSISTRIESPPVSPRTILAQQPPSYFTASSSSNTFSSYTHTPKQRLTSSSSRSSLASIASSATTTAQGLSDHTYNQLRDYSNSFDHVRDWKRRVTLA